jgi:F-type H+-transporting ATPase subunit gamma
VVDSHEGLPEDASTWPIEEIANPFIQDFQNGLCDEVVIYYTKFFSAVTQRVVRQPLLPFLPAEISPATGALASRQGRKYSPQPEEIFASLIPQLIRTSICQAGFESKASEHAARMTAMDSATRNADDLIERLRLTYNRARQSAITKELLDILGGAEAANG